MTTTDSDENVKKIADAVLQQQLAACVQILPIQSRYVWKGNIESGSEFLMLFKAKSSDYEALQKVISSNHSYEVPEVISLDIEKGSAAYFDWITNSTRSE